MLVLFYVMVDYLVQDEIKNVCKVIKWNLYNFMMQFYGV